MNREITGSLIWAGGLIAVAVGASLAREQGYVDGDTVTRIVLGLTGLMIAWYGNRMPKTFVPDVQVRKAQRVGGWAMALSGLVYAGLWIFAPMPVALIGGCGAIIAGMAVTFGYCLSLRSRAKAA